MASEKTKGDAIRIYLSGAASDGGAQADPMAAFGNYRSATELEQMTLQGALENITVEIMPGCLGLGDAAIESDGAGNLRFLAPGASSAGAWVAVGDGETKLLIDASGLFWARVSRSGDAPAVGTAVFNILDIFNLLWANVDDTERQAGSDKYRALIIKNESASAVTLRFALGLLGTQRAVNSSGYADSGAVTVTVKTGHLNDWPESGFVYNKTTGEVMYYASRSSSALSVAAGGRDVYSDVSGGAAGSEDDEIYPVPGLRIGKEAPSGQPNGYVQTIANENTAPTSITWLHPAGLMDNGCVEEVDLASGYLVALWIHRKILAGAAASALQKNRLLVESWQ